MNRERMIPIEHVDRAILLVERYGTAEDKAALGDATNILRRVVHHSDRVAQRKAIIAIADNVRQRRTSSESPKSGTRLPAGQPKQLVQPTESNTPSRIAPER
jgi:hypothetical protein